MKISRWLPLTGLLACLAGILVLTRAAGRPLPGQDAERTETAGTKIAEGEYAVYEQAGGGELDPVEKEVYNFHESWTLWRVEKGQYHVEGVRRFESPKGDPHSNRFTVELSRDLTILRLKEFAKLRWVRDSGP